MDNAEWQEMRNSIEIIRNRVTSLDRITVMGNKERLIADLKDVVGSSQYKAAILQLCKAEMGAGELAALLGTDSSNLSKFTRQLIATGYLVELKRGAKKFFLRDGKLDMIQFESLSPFKELIGKWRAERNG